MTDLGVFSVSLSVKDIKKSREFYEKLGFKQIDGKEEENWLILQNGEAKIGLFQDMFEGNILTFNPTDLRTLQADLKKNGVTFKEELDENHPQGWVSATLIDPDGNAILLDQHDS